MDVSAEQVGEIWINQAFCIPSIPESSKERYPFSRDDAFVYRLKLAAVLLNAAAALCRVEEPCLRLSLLLNCWLLFVTCEQVYKNYPWREPLTVWMWKFYWAIPYSWVPLSICSILLLNLGVECELTYPWIAVTVGWLCCMLVWPRIRESWHKEERSEDDYDQFSASRSYVWMLPGSSRMIFAALHSKSLLPFLSAFTLLTISPFFLRGWTADVWALSTGGLIIGCLAVLCCHRLPNDVGRTLYTWEKEEASYGRKIENCLRIVKGSLRTSGIPCEGSTRFDRLAIQVPLLLRETEILRNASRTITKNRIEELEKLTTGSELMKFRGKLDAYGPYTTECCIS